MSNPANPQRHIVFNFVDIVNQACINVMEWNQNKSEELKLICLVEIISLDKYSVVLWPAYFNKFVGVFVGVFLNNTVNKQLATYSVRERGLEPLRLSAPDPKSGAATNYATSASFFKAAKIHFFSYIFT